MTRCMKCQTPLPLWDAVGRDVRESLKAWGIKPLCPSCLPCVCDMRVSLFAANLNQPTAPNPK